MTSVCAFASSASAAELYVDDSAPGGGDGSIASPFTTVQAAIDAAANGDDILVAGGMYAAFAVDSKEVHLLGGYDAAFAETSPDTASIVEGNSGEPAVSLFESGDSVLDGFTVRGGQRGVFIDADYLSTTNKPVVRNNLIEQNGDTMLVGGGVVADHCEASFIGNTVRGNVGDRGAGIAAFCTTLLVEDNVIEGNVASGDHGGGLYMSGATLTVRGNMFRDNEVGVIAGYGWGGGALAFGEGVNASFARNVFTENHAMSLGSGAFIDDGASATFIGDLFYANECGTEGGGGLMVDGYDVVPSYARLTNVTIASHDCGDIPGGAINVQTVSTVELVNSIVWGNGGDDFATDGTSMITGTYTLSEEALEGNGNLSEDPLFADPAVGDYHVRSTEGRFDPATAEFVVDDVDSPTIDAGDPASEFAMEPAPNGLRVNMGHTGNTPEASMGGPGGETTAGEESSGGDTEGGTGVDDTGGGGTDGGSEDDGEQEGTAGSFDDGSSGDDGGEHDTMTVSCTCTSGGTTPPWTTAFVLVGFAAARLRRRRA